MRSVHLACLSLLLASAGAAGAQTTQAPTGDVQGCVQTDDTNTSNIQQSADYNVAACVQAGRTNTSTINQNGRNNTARTVQVERPTVPRTGN